VSVATVTARVAELQSLLAGVAPSAPAPAPAASSSASASFAEQLAGATGSGGATPVADTSSGSGSGTDATLAALTGTGTTSATGTASATGAAGGSSLPADVPYRDLITAAARRQGIDPALLAGLIRQESGFNPRAGSPAGAQGLTQLMPATARGLGVGDPFDPAQSIEGGAKYLATQLQHFGGDVSRALAAYNAGPGAVERFGGVPPYAETQNYVRNVQAFAAGYRGRS
jgi:soluble lytic murein transglycosylase-like protein